MEKVDYKKKYKDLYSPKTSPMIIDVPKITYVAVSGKGNPNAAEGDYQKAISILYGISYIIKMSHKSSTPIKGYFDYMVPPLEGLWWMEDLSYPDFSHKEKFHWTSMIRLPEFVDEYVFEWACREFQKKHPEVDISNVQFMTYEEGLCVQVMHKGSYDDEPATIDLLHTFMNEEGYTLDFDGVSNDGNLRRHHEIYLSDPRKANPKNWKTVIRHPIRKR